MCRLKRALYCLKQACCAWYTKIANYLICLGLNKKEVDANLYHIFIEGKLVIIISYVDDLILIGDEQLIRSCKEEFQMNDTGLMKYFLGLEVCQDDGELFVSQGKYENEILQRFHMESCKPMETPLTTNWGKEDVTSGKVVDAIIY